jgi:hypothetical protein
MIQVETLDKESYKVTVSQGSTTTHNVRLPADYHEDLTGGALAPELLIRRSFEFLLERESNTSILTRFTLSDIERYFPEFRSVARTWVEEAE